MRAKHLVHSVILAAARPFAAASPTGPVPATAVHEMSRAELAAAIRVSCGEPLGRDASSRRALFATTRGRLLLSLAAWCALPRKEAEAIAADPAILAGLHVGVVDRLREVVVENCAGCGTVATATVAMAAAARNAARDLTSARYLWTRELDPGFWHVVNGYGRPAHHAEAVGPFALRAAEMELGEPLTLRAGDAEFLAERALSRFGP